MSLQKFVTPLLLGGAAVALMVNFGSAGARAQGAQAADADAFEIEEIVVQSRKRGENLQDVPATVAAFTEDAIDSIGVSSMRDYAQLIPNFFLIETQNSSFAFVNIRGITQMRNLDPSVAIVIDGVLSTSAIGMSQELFDIQQIEVLKGPQGALYGRNAMAGAINISTKRPTNEFEGFIRGGYGNGNAGKGQASISGPIVEDRLFGRLAASYYNADGWRPNVTRNKPSDPAENFSLRGRLIYDPSATFEADLRFSVTDDNGAALQFTDTAPVWAPFPPNPALSLGCAVGIFPAASGQCLAGPVTLGTLSPVPNPTNPRTGIFQGDVNDFDVPLQGNLLGIDRRRLYNISLLMSWQTDIGTLTSITSWDQATNLARGEQPPRTAVAALANSQWRNTKTISQEIRLTSPGDQALRWIAGAYFVATDAFLSTTVQRDSRGIDTLDTFIKRDPLPLACAPGGFPLPGTPFDTPIDCVIGFDGDLQKNTAYAFFAQINYDVTDLIELSFSARYDRDERRQTILTPDRYLAFFAAGDPTLVFGAKRKANFDSFQPKATLRFTPRDNFMTYVSYAQGFRSGGFNRPGIEARANALRGVFPPGFIPPGIFDVYPDQNTMSIEGGFKFNSPGGRFIVNASGFYTEVDDYQTFTFNGQLNASQIIIPLDEVKISGFEIDASVLVTEGISLSASYGLTDSEITKDSFRGFVGNRAPQTPKSTINLGLQYETPFTLVSVEGNFFFRMDYQRIGKLFFMPANWVARNSVDIVNMRGGFNIGETVQIVGWVRNLTNANYFAEGFNDAGGLFFFGKLRQYGFELTKRF